MAEAAKKGIEEAGGSATILQYVFNPLPHIGYLTIPPKSPRDTLRRRPREDARPAEAAL